LAGRATKASLTLIVREPADHHRSRRARDFDEDDTGVAMLTQGTPTTVGMVDDMVTNDPEILL